MRNESPYARRGAFIASLVGAAIVAALVLDVMIETDAEGIERVLTEYNDDLVRGHGEEACAALTARAQRELVEEATAKLAEALEPPTCRRAVETVADRLSGAVRNRQARPPTILKIKVEGSRAIAQVGASFAYERIPLTRESAGWRLTTTRAAAVVRDAPEGDPPSPADFTARAEGACRNSQRLFVPAAARLVAAPDPTSNPEAAKAVGGLLRELSSADRALADALSSLTASPGSRGEVQHTVDALRGWADVRDSLAEAVAEGRSGGTEPAARSAARAQRAYRQAASDAGLETALNDCL